MSQSCLIGSCSRCGFSQELGEGRGSLCCAGALEAALGSPILNAAAIGGTAAELVEVSRAGADDPIGEEALGGFATVAKSALAGGGIAAGLLVMPCELAVGLKFGWGGTSLGFPPPTGFSAGDATRALGSGEAVGSAAEVSTGLIVVCRLTAG